MRFWTTQTEDVINIILSRGLYKPDFNLSNGFGGNKMKPAYDEILNVYCYRNNIDCKGLVFGITQLNDIAVKNIEQYKLYFSKNKMFWNSVSNSGEKYAILELEVPDEIDTIPIYFQDFIVLCMRNIRSYEFQNYVKPQLKNIEFQDFRDDLNIAQSIGWTDDTEFDFDVPVLNRIVQAHIHQIPIEYIKGVYGTFDFETEKEYSLGEKALQLHEHINSR
ncbi:hypothetical protein KM800_14290 [Clostridium tyrobutyricum]|uniref:hypothetical protein n=1 Tax=Clostridium tyrobutyricum TaxID=1519 RepID=UPI001C3868A9|nr:hypothetical protein [Clostridium tyrobutyricum]MBV4420475.1 hypothetical protein [Clostridium tyrobutyricum]